MAIFGENIASSTPVMAGLVPAIHGFGSMAISKSWMPDMKSGMTKVDVDMLQLKNTALLSF